MPPCRTPFLRSHRPSFYRRVQIWHTAVALCRFFCSTPHTLGTDLPVSVSYDTTHMCVHRTTVCRGILRQSTLTLPPFPYTCLSPFWFGVTPTNMTSHSVSFSLIWLVLLLHSYWPLSSNQFMSHFNPFRYSFIADSISIYYSHCY